MIPADILTALLVIFLAIVPTWLVLRHAGRAVARKRARLVEPETHGDMGGLPMPTSPGDEFYYARPKAPEIGSGLPPGPPARSIFRPGKARDMRPIDGD